MTDFNPDFREWPKTPRLFRDIVITEKIDGTNAGLHISEDGQVVAQSRKRIITPDNDNYGFARWAAENADELAHILGPGLHFGEWWGQGIQRRYGLEQKVFSLFNTERWYKNDGADTSKETRADQSSLVDQIDVVPVLYQGPFSEAQITSVLRDLKEEGSYAAPGFMNPEGICVYHSQTRSVFKVTLDANDAGKWEAAA
ncbi:RNA ligase family protein [Streptomyces sp. NBC_00464]|uniref:RNA ligase family protein n=1 Tax=Streptomyces sp. NBC_00464 TaxID=2975751 RepID=UPI002E17031D